MRNFTLLALIVLTFVSCEIPGGSGGITQNKKSIICLLDISGSTKESNLSTFLDNIADEVISKMEDDTSVVILAIDNGSQTAANPLFEIDMSTINFVDESLPMTVRDKMAKIKKAEFLKELIGKFKMQTINNINERKAYATHTDIFGSLNQIKRYKGTTTKVMIFSDMLNYSETFNMERLVRQNKNLVNHIKNAPKVTCNGKVEIYISTGDNVNLGPKKFNAVKEFWETYLNQNAYSLVDYTSSKISI